MRTSSLSTLAAAVLAVGAVVSCSSSEVGESPDTTGASADGAFPVTIDTKFGEVTVESKPQRVVALGWADAETALALGVQPVGASDWLAFGGDGVGPWAEGLYDASPEIIGTQEPSYEAVAALEPDVILDTKSSGDQDRYDRLSQIAPTIALPEGADNYLTSLDQQVTMVSAALGESAKGAELLSEVEADFAAAVKQNPEFVGKTITVGAYSGTGYGAYVSDSTRMQFMKKLGFVSNPTIDALPPQGFSVPISDEELGLLDADLVVIFPIQTSPSDVTDNPLFRAIPAVQDGRSLVFDDPVVAKSYSTSSVLSLQYAVEQVVPLLADRLQQ
ncbi:iron-siderophore ABC transporter substrate-binding protein [Rhodococcus sp. BP-252]|uniref:iron-siderophore ABC transporter substrate-binding protein n=1 Tax=unclassified Rhodococcus (in: high G+C Gram-positive bacteria) TaxID=192944 RepID=UPI001C9A4CB5|nr:MULTISPECIES: iron-siderophore ABC transporter substrate-binding protein [unclassified Rhodococcus (in: high G+C Gram-positive bacteria)]MBY6410937.1 iron-siderophore ABC transporter substrate-binding protein [Rhodococcus sp. BP-320]MBY6415596.1 iron-siderophore ABC transporter substrate-binding protein [Rhodococcus sp. BP-321]MBY6421022.1 iron-siderophore ABC transporter substrate-binding protein [Rhodococcus sp. BP-324]MBY6426077.1 iron-siderophore ABC transporter substrate-binding protein